MIPALDIAKEFKRIGFHRLDTQRRGQGMVQVNANQLIDLCLAFESAAEGDISNLEYSLKVSRQQIDQQQREIEWLTEKLYDAGVDVLALYRNKPDFEKTA